jgi:aspartyl-tRNA(Asn)/glutamyl-tRNA(Gln) amidotransferase subunit A
MALCWTLDKVGPMCRSADDCGLVLAAIAGQDPRDPTTVAEPFTYSREAPAKKWRVGVPRHAAEGAQPEVKAAFEKSVAALAEFCGVEKDVEFPDLPWGPAVGIIVDAEGASAFRDFIETGGTRKLRAAADRVGAYSAIMTLAVDYLQAMRARVPMRRELDALLARYDALVVPTRTRVTYPIGYDFDKPPGPTPAPAPTPAPGVPRPPSAPATIPAGNLAGLPAICVPNGVGAEGIPTSLQLLGRAFSESTLLAIANRYQQATDWHKRRPPAFSA